MDSRGKVCWFQKKFYGVLNMLFGSRSALPVLFPSWGSRSQTSGADFARGQLCRRCHLRAISLFLEGPRVKRVLTFFFQVGYSTPPRRREPRLTLLRLTLTPPVLGGQLAPHWGLDSLSHLPASQSGCPPHRPSASQTGCIRGREEDRAAHLPPSTIKERALNLGPHREQP